jgi:hypothetical protein
MDWNSLSRRLFKFGAWFAAAILAYWLLRNTGLYDFTRLEIEGLNTLILLVGSIYAVTFAFAIFVIWGQFNDVENLVMRECHSLSDLLRFGRYLNADAAHAIRRAVTEYARRALESEWDALSERRRDKETENYFTKLINTVIQTVPSNPTEGVIHQSLIDIARKAGEHRDDRITKSLTRIPPTLVWLVNTMAVALLLLIFVYPFHHGLAGAACFALIAIVLFFANLVMTDTDNPFKGVCNVSPQPFSDLLL